MPVSVMHEGVAKPSRSYRIRRLVGRAGEELQEKAWTVGRDPAEERRVRIAWTALEGVLGAAFTLAARRIATRSWLVLTGEPPPGRSR